MSLSRKSELELIGALRRINNMRLSAPTASRQMSTGPDGDFVESHYKASQKLAVYGSLAPGEANHSVVQEIRGSWTNGFVRGHLETEGWGSRIGFPGLKWDPDGDLIPVNVLVSDVLPEKWRYLDDFEGKEYVRILIPVERDRELIAVANIYTLRTDSFQDERPGRWVTL